MHSIPRHCLVVSCQAPATSPLHGPATMALMAQAAVAGGAAAIRANGPGDVAAIRTATSLPVIGIHKRATDSGVFITPSFADAAQLVQAGASLVAVDGTSRRRLDGTTLAEQIGRIRSELGVEVMADVDTAEAGLEARAAGADIVATTLSGYTESTAPSHESAHLSAEPDIALVRSLVAVLDCPVVAEGRFRTPGQVAAAFEAGAYAVVVGAAITDPVATTRWLASATPVARRDTDPASRAGTAPVVVVTDDASTDLASWLRDSVGAQVLRPDDVGAGTLSGAGGIAILGGCHQDPLVLPAAARIEIDARLRGGARVLSEYCRGVAHVEMDQTTTSTRFERLVAGSETLKPLGIVEGDLLDDQAGTRTVPHPASIRCSDPPLLQYAGDVIAHRQVRLTEDLLAEPGQRALWFELPNLLVCTFRLANFRRARFAPVGAWAALGGFVAEWLTDTAAPATVLPPAYTVRGTAPDSASTTLVRSAVESAVGWFTRADMLLDEGRRGVREGFATEISPDGQQVRQNLLGVRCDCTGESALAFYLHHRLTGAERSLAIAHNLVDAFYDLFQVDDPASPLDGMVRWSEGEWGLCYQDDVARGLIPQLLMLQYDGTAPRLPDARRALEFLLSTTGTDGTRRSSTAECDLTPDQLRALAAQPGNCPSAHRNAHYAAALLLAGHLDGEERYVDAGVRCLSTIMAAYPDTQRVMSETSELCRLVFPLGCLVQATGDAAHRAWLYRVVEDLQRLRHPSGGYLEWDTGYQARLSRQVGNECSLLVRNGDPIVDLLYSTNWLPMGFAHAHQVTGDAWFRTLWEDVAAFVANVQLRGGDPGLDGAWARAFDVELGEVYGMPNDVGWGPWAIETGWTMAPITSGLAMGLLNETPARDRPLLGG